MTARYLKTVFAIPKMDCAAEERLIRVALAGQDAVKSIHADLAARQLTVIHEGSPDAVDSAVQSLNLGSRLVDTVEAAESDSMPAPSQAEEARALTIVLAINGGMFVVEALGALMADSSALLADSLDMFADAAVYGIALFGVHRARATQLKAARMSGVLQLLLAAGALAEVVRRLVFGSEPEAPLMVVVAAAALTANATSMWLLARHRQGGAHMKASWIFTTNDVIANVGVIVAAGLVRLLESNVPDLVVATGIAFIVLNGAMRILRLKE
ncbi:MAG TPA: cation transporter [Vicinamibacterales bacterium]|jgi:Co/Zn/Cd efflux system component